MTVVVVVAFETVRSEVRLDARPVTTRLRDALAESREAMCFATSRVLQLRVARHFRRHA